LNGPKVPFRPRGDREQEVVEFKKLPVRVNQTKGKTKLEELSSLISFPTVPYADQCYAEPFFVNPDQLPE
jgi:antitoxin (DNA-binding transcriptional repressor) of toxin-antitoxin stability system